MDRLGLYDEKNILVERIYNKDNYKVIMKSNINICYIFFSSNGIFFPDTVQEFEEKIIKKNRYEWENLANSKMFEKRCGKQIFVRDIYKSWYIRGINSRINTIEKLINLLSELTRGYEIITVGISAGGYMAALAALKLNAKMCFDFSGQVNLYKSANKNPFFIKEIIGHDDTLKTKHLNIVKEIENSKCKFYYFYAAKCQEDRENADQIGEFENVQMFPFFYKKHAATMFVWNMPYILTKSEEEMDRLARGYAGKIINPFLFSIRTMPLKDAFICPIRKVLRILIRKLKKRDSY